MTYEISHRYYIKNKKEIRKRQKDYYMKNKKIINDKHGMRYRNDPILKIQHKIYQNSYHKSKYNAKWPTRDEVCNAYCNKPRDISFVLSFD